MYKIYWIFDALNHMAHLGYVSLHTHHASSHSDYSSSHRRYATYFTEYANQHSYYVSRHSGNVSAHSGNVCLQSNCARCLGSMRAPIVTVRQGIGTMQDFALAILTCIASLRA